MRAAENKMQKRQMIILMICILFLFSVATGAIFANAFSDEEMNEIYYSVTELFEKENAHHFSTAFLKYLKYDILIWLGGCFDYGAILSAGVLAFRGISLGYTSAVLFRACGIRAVLAVMGSMLPQNIILLPAYFFMTWLAFCFLIERTKGQYGKGALKRESTRKWTEYVILLCCSILAVAVAALIEIYFSAKLLSMISVLL